MKKTLLYFIFLSTIPSLTAAPFCPDSLYSKWAIDSRMGDFRNKTSTEGFLTSTTPANATWDYVSGLVAKAILKAWEQYKDQSWSQYYFIGIQHFADNQTMTLGESNIDDLNAGKIFFELYRGALGKGETTKVSTYKNNATTCRNRLKYNHQRIDSNLPGAGGFWHKKQYTNQMWLDGLYMGAALYAEWQGNFGTEQGETDNLQSWNDIALQFDTVFAHTWDSNKKLNYHAWSAEPSNAASSYWANVSTGRSQEFWGRGVGWFFAALVDVLEYMPEQLSARNRLISYANQVAEGLSERQDENSGCWYQLLQYDNTKKGISCNINNYLESSASCMFTYAYLKGIRLGILDKNIYTDVAEKAYKGLIENFVVEENNKKIKLIQSCESAGLSGTRKGDANYYLCGSDVKINSDTEGKVLGPFIMASLEYELVKKSTAIATTKKEKLHCNVKKKEKSIEIVSAEKNIQKVSIIDTAGLILQNWVGAPTNMVDMNMLNYSRGIYFIRVNDQKIKYFYH